MLRLAVIVQLVKALEHPAPVLCIWTQIFSGCKLGPAFLVPQRLDVRGVMKVVSTHFVAS